MGYYTDFELTANDEQLEKLKGISGYTFEDDGSLYDAKWYRHVEDMKSLSIEYPEILFTLKGTGEESGDIWVKYFKAGKMQECRAQIVFSPFDENKLN